MKKIITATLDTHNKNLSSDADKEFTERKTTLLKWEGNAIEIPAQLKHWLKLTKRNRNIDDAEERNKLLQSIDYDDIVIDYLGSLAYIDKTLKNKNDSLSENEHLYCEKVDYLANYIVFPDQKKYGILTNNQKRNVGRSSQQEGRTSFTRNVSYIAEEHDFATEEIETPLSSVDLTNTEHVKILLNGYHDWKELLYEQNKLDSEFAKLLQSLDHLIATSNFSSFELQLIDLLKRKKFDKLTYDSILAIINQQNVQVYTYRQIEHHCNITIPKKIAKTARLIL